MRTVAKITSITCLVSTIGALLAVRWLACISALRCSDYAVIAFIRNDSLIAATVFVGGIIAILGWFSKVWSISRVTLAIAILSASFSLVLCIFLYLTARAFLTAWPELFTVVVPIIALATAAAYLARARFALLSLVPLFLAFLSWSHPLNVVFGDDLAAGAYSYAPHPSMVHYAELTVILVLFGWIYGWAHSFFCGFDCLKGAVLGAVSGAFCGICLSIVYSVMFCAVMASGHSPVIAFLATLAITGALAATTTGAVVARRHRPNHPAQALPVLALVAAVGYVLLSLSGSAAFQRLNTLHSDTTYAYIHFSNGGVYRRTIDQSGSITKSWRSHNFLIAYPFSAYRPAAQVLSAESDFDLWRFDEAFSSLREHRRTYPYMQGYPDVLYVLTALASNRPGAALFAPASNEYCLDWISSQGALMAGTAAERLNMPSRATGFNSAYINHLAGQRATAWSTTSADFARNRISEIEKYRHRHPARRIATVSVRVTYQGEGVEGVRIVLVQPHKDAALPADSIQFTGAWTIPAWNGFWAITDRDGVADVHGVTPGTYDIVIGLNRANTPPHIVVAPHPEPVTVDGTNAQLPTITLANAVVRLFPTTGLQQRTPTFLEWKPCPKAHSYSVALIHRPEITDTNLSAMPDSGGTCWMKKGISSTHTTIDPGHFVNGWNHLHPGAYTWFVQAYASDGTLVSTSECYFDLSEPVFIVPDIGSTPGAKLKPRRTQQ